MSSAVFQPVIGVLRVPNPDFFHPAGTPIRVSFAPGFIRAPLPFLPAGGVKADFLCFDCAGIWGKPGTADNAARFGHKKLHGRHVVVRASILWPKYSKQVRWGILNRRGRRELRSQKPAKTGENLTGVNSFARQSVNRFEPEIELYREAVHVGELAESGKAEENREKLKKIGSNFRIGRRRLSVEFKKPWELLLNFNSARAEKNFFSAEFFKSQKVRRGRDSNP